MTIFHDKYVFKAVIQQSRERLFAVKIDNPPQDMKFQLIVEPLAQQPIRKSIHPLF
jgi:hypothetical protein